MPRISLHVGLWISIHALRKESDNVIIGMSET